MIAAKSTTWVNAFSNFSFPRDICNLKDLISMDKQA